MRQAVEANIKRKNKKKSKITIVEEEVTIKPKPKFPVPLDYYNSPKAASSSKKNNEEAKDKDALMNILSEIRSPIQVNKTGMATPMSPSNRLRTEELSQSASPCTSEDYSTPLARRIVNKYCSPAVRKGESMASMETSETDLSGVEALNETKEVVKRRGRPPKKRIGKKSYKKKSVEGAEENVPEHCSRVENKERIDEGAETAKIEENVPEQCSRVETPVTEEVQAKKPRGRPRKSSDDKAKNVMVCMNAVLEETTAGRKRRRLTLEASNGGGVPASSEVKRRMYVAAWAARIDR